MNITHQDRIDCTIALAEQRLRENKSSVKTYKSKVFAQSVADKLSQNLCAYWNIKNAPVEVVQLSNGRFFCAPDLYYITTKAKQGGYVFAYLDGHFCLQPELRAAGWINEREAA